MLEITIWLNRFGIILNFIAGFMMAPELIGLERLRRAEQQLENTLQRWNGFFQKLISPLTKNISGIISQIKKRAGIGEEADKDTNILYLSFFVFSILQITALPIILAFYFNNKNETLRIVILADLTILVLFFLMLFIDMFSQERKKQGVLASIKETLGLIGGLIGIGLLSLLEFLMNPLSLVFGVLLLLVILFFLVLIVLALLIALPIYIIVFVTIYPIQKITNFILTKLEGDERLRAFVVTSGIVFFVLGNLFQFIGTF